MLVPALLVGWLSWIASGRRDAIALLVCGTILVAADLGLRWRARSGLVTAGKRVGASGWLLQPGMGGALYVVPLWAIGAIQLGVGVARALGVTG